MKVSKKTLVEKYRTLSTSELLALKEGEITELARSVLEDELMRRASTVEAKPDLHTQREMEEDMDRNNEEEFQAFTEKLYAFVAEQMKAGADKQTIIQKLVEMEVDSNVATEIVETIYPQILNIVEEEQVTASSLVPAMIGGGIAAGVGGGIWGAIVIGSGYEIGFMAWGLGLICGFAVVLSSQGRKGVPLQMVAVLASVLGIVVGKYVTFYHFLKLAVKEGYGAEAASRVSFFSETVVDFFIGNIGSMMGGFDILWVILAVITAWRIPKGTGIQLPR